jgi:hypothetical protein
MVPKRKFQMIQRYVKPSMTFKAIYQTLAIWFITTPTRPSYLDVDTSLERRFGAGLCHDIGDPELQMEDL